jgi:hypothetical protein
MTLKRRTWRGFGLFCVENSELLPTCELWKTQHYGISVHRPSCYETKPLDMHTALIMSHTWPRDIVIGFVISTAGDIYVNCAQGLRMWCFRLVISATESHINNNTRCCSSLRVFSPEAFICRRSETMYVNRDRSSGMLSLLLILRRCH